MTAKNTWATIAYGSHIKLHHQATDRVLHSHSHFYHHPGGSGQQQVTAYEGHDDNDWWVVKGPHGEPADVRVQQPVRHGDIIRLEHLATRRNLHSHGGFPSPVTGQQEVTCFGIAGVGDDNDNWRIEIEGGGNWDTGKHFRLVHVNSNHVLHSHLGFSHPEWTMGQQEVTCFEGRDGNDWWTVEPFLISTVRTVSRNAFYGYEQPLPEGEPPIDPSENPQEEFIETLHTTYAHVSIPDNERTELPVVVLIHGISGNFHHMANPAISPSFNHDRQAPIPPLRDHGWRMYPGIGNWSHDLDPPKPVTSWQTALNNAGFRTVNFSQFDPRGRLKLPLLQLSQLLGDVMQHPQHQGRQFVLLGHSRGGLLARAVVTLPTEERKFDIRRIQQLITLHSPHHGSAIANIANSLSIMMSYANQNSAAPYAPFGIAEKFRFLLDEVTAEGYQEIEINSDFLKDLAPQEPVPGIQYATFGGNSTVLSRHRLWQFTWGSKVPRPKFRWQTEPLELGDFTPESAVRLLMGVRAPVSLPLPAELRHGEGDLLVTDKASRLPWAPHQTNPLNHAEALWDPDLQQQVISVITTGDAKAKSETNVSIQPTTSNLDFRPGEYWVTGNGYKLAFQTDGNLVVYNPSGAALWATGTAGSGADRLSVQCDGNVVLYYNDGRALWATNTSGYPGARLVVQVDGNVVVYDSNNVARFSTNTGGGQNSGVFNAASLWRNVTLQATTSNLDFRPGEYWVTGNGYSLAFQTDGNLVVYNPSGTALWATGTAGSGTGRLSVQCDGNVVLYHNDGRALWATNTSGYPGARLVVQVDGNVVVYDSNNVARFSTNTEGGRNSGVFNAASNRERPEREKTLRPPVRSEDRPVVHQP